MFLAVVVVVILIVIHIGNGPAVPDNVQIIENIGAVGVEDVIVTVLPDPKTWHHL